MKNLTITFFAFILCSYSGEAPLLHERAKQLLWNGELPTEIRLDPEGNISIFAPGARQPEFRLKREMISLCSLYFDQSFSANWKQYCAGTFAPVLMGVTGLSNKTDSLPLLGIRIALDPGHIAGEYSTARLERKSVQLRKDSLKGILSNDTIIEGRLTMLTALELKKKLEARGAVVLLTREKNDHCAFGKTFDKWWKEDLKRCLDSAFAQGHITAAERTKFLKTRDKKLLFREYFLQEDLRERARKINAFDPDLAIIIHYNVDEKNEGWLTTTTKNHSMCFVPGAIFPGALNKKEARFNLLRLLVSDHYPKSVRAAGLICKYFVKELGVPAAGSKDAGYLESHCLYTGTPGVFSRNLALTRLPHCPVVYGETLYQDNEKEFAALTLKALRKEPVPKRIQQVADAYYKGILEFFSP